MPSPSLCAGDEFAATREDLVACGHCQAGQSRRRAPARRWGRGPGLVYGSSESSQRGGNGLRDALVTLLDRTFLKQLSGGRRDGIRQLVLMEERPSSRHPADDGHAEAAQPLVVVVLQALAVTEAQRRLVELVEADRRDRVLGSR